MTAAAVETLAAQIDSKKVDVAEQWPWSDGTNPDLWLYRDRTVAFAETVHAVVG